MPEPPELVGRDYDAFLRGPVGTDTFCFGTRAAWRNSLEHAPRLSVHPAPSDPGESEFGIVGAGTFKVEIADEDDVDWFLEWPDGSFILWENLEQIVVEY